MKMRFARTALAAALALALPAGAAVAETLTITSLSDAMDQNVESRYFDENGHWQDGPDPSQGTEPGDNDNNDPSGDNNEPGGNDTPGTQPGTEPSDPDNPLTPGKTGSVSLPQGGTAVKTPFGGSVSHLDSYRVTYNGLNYDVPAEVVTFERGDMLYYSSKYDKTNSGTPAWQPVIEIIAPENSTTTTLAKAKLIKTKIGRTVTASNQNWASTNFKYCANSTYPDGYINPETGELADYAPGFVPMRYFWNGVQPYNDKDTDGNITTAYALDWDGDDVFDQAFLVKVNPATGFSTDTSGGLKAVRYTSKGAVDGGYENLSTAVGAMDNKESVTLLADDSGKGFPVDSNTYTVDLNGFTYTFDYPIAEQFKYGVYNAGGNLTIKSGTTTPGTLTIKENAGIDKLMYNYGNFTLDNVTLDGYNAYGAYTLYSTYGNVNINKSTLKKPASGYALGAGCVASETDGVQKTTGITVSNDSVFDNAYIYNKYDYNTDSFISYGSSVKENRLGPWTMDPATKSLVRTEIVALAGPVSYEATVADITAIELAYRSNIDAVLKGMSFTGGGFDQAAAGVANDQVINEAHDQFRADKKANPEIGFVDSMRLMNVFVSPKLDVTVEALNSNSFDFEVVSHYDLYVTSAQSFGEIVLLDDVKSGNVEEAVNAIKFSITNKTLPVNGAINVTLSVPMRFFIDNGNAKDFFVYHYKTNADGTDDLDSYYAYNTNVVKTAGSDVAAVSFVDSHGFSKFSLTAVEPDLPVHYGSEYYENLQGAVDAVDGAGTIVINAPSTNEDGSYSAIMGGFGPGQMKVVTIEYGPRANRNTAPVYMGANDGYSFWEMENVLGNEVYVSLVGPCRLSASGSPVTDTEGNVIYYNDLTEALDAVLDGETIQINGGSTLIKWTGLLSKAVQFNIASAPGVVDAKVDVTLVDGLEQHAVSGVATNGMGSYVITGEPILNAGPFSRLYGETALDTMREVVKDSHAKTSSRFAVVATNATYHDALSASGFAGLLNAPLILTDRWTLSPEAEETIKHVKSARGMTVFVIGGPMAVSDEVLAQIDAIDSISVKRIWGQAAWDTSLEVYRYGKYLSDTNNTVTPWGDNVVLSTSNTFQDALSISPYCYAKNTPIILTNAFNVIAEDAVETVKGFDQVIITGGELAVGLEVGKQIGNLHTRLYGQDAYATSNAIAEWVIKYGGMDASHIGVATGQNYHDALVASAHCGKSAAPLILADSTNLTTVDAHSQSFMAKNASEISQVRIYGGPLAVGQDVEGRIKSLLKIK